MKNKNIFLIILTIILCLSSFVFSFNLAYSDSGWDSSYGGGGYSSSSSYDSGGSYSSGSSHSSGGPISFIGSLVFFVICIIASIFSLIESIKMQKAQKIIDKKLQTAEAIPTEEIGTEEDEEKLKKELTTLYEKYLNNIDNPLVLNKLCTSNMLDNMEIHENDKKHIIENVSVLELNITMYDKKESIIKAYFTISCNDYYVDKDNNYTGYKDKLKYNDYIVTFRYDDKGKYIDNIDYF